MDELCTIQELTHRLYDELIGKVIAKTPLTEREQIAYYGLDFRVRLEMGAYDGIWQNPQPFIDSLTHLGLIDQARKLAHAVRLGADRLDRDQRARETCENEIGVIGLAHLEGDDTVLERLVFDFWKRSAP